MRERVLGVGVFVLAAAVLVVGWNLFWFLCDDAFIAFRYVDHARRGWGYVWNPAPFMPVEGYTSFLWVVLLQLVWWLTGVEPPDSANPLGLAIGLVTLALTAVMAWRVPVSPALRRLRVPMLALVLFGIVSNRTYLAFTSSGLETALVSLWLVAWAAVALLGRPMEDRRHLLALVTFSSLLALTRPDGYLYCGATGVLVLVHLWRVRPRGAAIVRELAVASPFLLPVAHLIWRRITYDMWVPNTYYAKYVAPWPQAGVPYVGSFLIEYAYWVWVLLAVIVSARSVWRARQRRPDLATFARGVAIAALLGQVAYYVLLIGGDHFEFRIFHHLVPLLVVTLPWLADQLGIRPGRVLLLLTLMIAMGLPIPWIHWMDTKDLNYDQASKLRYRVSPHFPSWLRWYSRSWDRTQDIVTRRFVGLRHQTHKTFVIKQTTRFPTRDEGLLLPTDDWPVYHHISVGWPGWVMPTLPFIDEFGLSDRVVATMAPRRNDPYKRFMAHDRKTPEGYIECFDPNVKVKDRKVTIRERAVPMTEARIVECERTFLEYARLHAGDPPSLPSSARKPPPPKVEAPAPPPGRD